MQHDEQRESECVVKIYLRDEPDDRGDLAGEALVLVEQLGVLELDRSLLRLGVGQERRAPLLPRRQLLHPGN